MRVQRGIQVVILCCSVKFSMCSGVAWNQDSSPSSSVFSSLSFFKLLLPGEFQQGFKLWYYVTLSSSASVEELFETKIPLLLQADSHHSHSSSCHCHESPNRHSSCDVMLLCQVQHLSRSCWNQDSSPSSSVFSSLSFFKLSLPWESKQGVRLWYYVGRCLDPD